jgi:putative nucleotidyltransferase with HDIG domain
MNAKPLGLPAACRRYVLVVSLAGLAIAAHSLIVLFITPVSFEWFALAALTLLTGSFTVRIPGIPARLSVSDTFVFASVLMFGPAAGTITALLDALIISLRLGHHTREPFRVVFNVSVAALSAWTAALVFFGLAGIAPYTEEHTPLGQILLPLLLFTTTYFLTNSWLVTIALALEKRIAAFPAWRDNFLWLSVNYFGGASVAGLLVTYTRVIDLTTLGIIIPLLLISYLTFKTSLGRIEDANRHLKEVNQLYLSTIETLAMAVDAKDQITHGHIRRVQLYAVGLARALGVRDEQQINAIEAAALLHDMGKLAIPEFILNKPGRLTASEFEIMKTHAGIGADILSSIHFPYPVVPIVRHHHENWDGSGYPEGTQGTSIPLGARILSVVDCFDALTSDRPYRPKLSDADAIDILVQRRGSMYDPLVVDTFIRVHSQLAADISAEPEPAAVISTIASRAGIPLGAATESERRTIGLDSLALLKTLSSWVTARDSEALGDALARHLTISRPRSALVLWGLDDSGTLLQPLVARGAIQVSDLLPIALGEHLSGWVAAHRTAVWNSDAALDLGTALASSTGMRLGSSAPLLVDGDLVGCLTLYGNASSEVSVSKRIQLETLSPAIAMALATARGADQDRSVDLRNPSLRDTTLALLDAALSHSENGELGTVIKPHVSVVTVVPVNTDVSPAKSYGEVHTNILAAELSVLLGEGGCVFRLTTTQLLVLTARSARSATRPENIEDCVARLMAGLAERHVSEARVSAIRGSLELRELFRRLEVAGEQAAASSAALGRLH